MQNTTSVYEFGPFRLDAAERLLRRGDLAVALTPKAFDLLVFLVERHGRLVTKQELMTALWPDTVVEEANLTYTVSALRKALGDGSDGERFIQTIPTRGYRFVAAVASERPPTVPPVRGEPPRREIRVLRAAVVVLAATVAAVIPGFVARLRETDRARAPIRLTIPVADTPTDWSSMPFAQISPDGRRVAFIVAPSAFPGFGMNGIYIRSMDATAPVLLRGTQEAISLFWAPDSQHLAFATPAALKKLTLSDGTIETLCDGCKPGRGGTWGRNESIIFVSARGELLTIPAAGGPPTAATTLKSREGEVAHVSPYFLPDGSQFLYSVRHTDSSRGGVFVGRVGSSERKLVLRGEYDGAVWAPEGYLLFNHAGTIAAQSFDLNALDLRGEPVPVVTSSDYRPAPLQGGDVIVGNWFGGPPSFSISHTGVLTYATAAHPESQFRWFGRDGEPLQVVGEPGAYSSFDVSRDGTRLVFSRIGDGGSSLWVHELDRGVSSRLTFGEAASYFDPRWGPGGRWLVANRRAPPPLAIVRIASDGRQSTLTAPDACILDDVSADGRQLLCRVRGRQLFAVAEGAAARGVLVRTPPAGFIDQSRLSPNGRWIAFNANESGRYEVYVTRFPPTEERWTVSPGGGVQPVWRQDGRELFYLARDGMLNAVEIGVGDPPQFSAPTPLFNTGLAAPSPAIEQYGANPSGQRFLMLRPVGMVRNSIGVILDWPALLQRRR